MQDLEEDFRIAAEGLRKTIDKTTELMAPSSEREATVSWLSALRELMLDSAEMREPPREAVCIMRTMVRLEEKLSA